ISGVPYSGPSIAEFGGDVENVLQFIIPQDNTKNGAVYVHVTAIPSNENRMYTYLKSYYFDNTAPTVSFNRSGSSYPRDKQEVAVTVVEPYTINGLVKKYVWVKDGEPEPVADAENVWKELPDNGEVELTNEELEQGETASFRLYVLAKDGAGNQT